tara:strand:- start:103 stop:549 length:447 start_codon:yes stop_codon:yes gene_type:complete
MSWTTPGQGYKLKEAIKINNKPDNPGAKVGDAANRKTEYSYIYVDGVSRDQAKKLMAPRDGLNDLLAGKTMYHKGVMRFLDRKTWGTVGKNRKDLTLSGDILMITNSKLGHLGSSQPDVVMVSKAIMQWLEYNDGGNIKIGSVLNDQR